MSNIRAAAVATTVLSAAVAASTVSAAVSTRSISVVQYVAPQITVSAFIVPTSTLENQTVNLSDFRQISVGQVSIDIATATDDVALSFDKVLADEVTMADTVNRMFYGNIDFDPSDPDADPDPITMADVDVKDIGKTLVNTVEAADVAVYTIGQVKADAVVAAEEINTKDVGKSLTDGVTTNDAINTFNTDKVVVDSVSATEALTKELTRPNVADSVTTADESFRSPGLGKTDAVTAADELNSFDIGTNPNDAVAASDAVNKFDVTTVFTDSVTMTDFIAKTPGYEFDYDITDADADPDPVSMTEVMAKSLTRPNITDAASIADSLASQVDTPRTDAVTTADSDAKSFDTPRSESVAATDAAAFTSGKVLTDATSGATDLMVFAASKVATDTVTGSDAINTFALNKTLTDTASMADSISLLLILGQSNPLYDFAFTSDDKFTYFPVPGALNEHLIHQPLVNGEFVLTTDPNAGIVYTIRTESYSYMFAGYGLNENQLN